MADALVVGWRMGETGLAAIGMTLPLFMVINLFMHGLGIGGSVRICPKGGQAGEAGGQLLRVLWLAPAASCPLALTVNPFSRQVLRLLGAEAAGEALRRQTDAYVRLIARRAGDLPNHVLNYYLRADGQQKRPARA